MFLIEVILLIFSIYLIAGFIFAIPFSIKGAGKIDEGANGGSWGFRIIIIPGSIVFWPILLKKWVRASRSLSIQNEAETTRGIRIKQLRKRHLQVWLLWAALLPAGIITAWLSIPGPYKNKLFQPIAEKALPVIETSVNKKEYTVNIRTDEGKNHWQLEWINNEVLTYPTATIYWAEGENKNIEQARLIGRIEARGNYYFQIDSVVKNINFSNDQLILYDFIGKQIIETIKLPF